MILCSYLKYQRKLICQLTVPMLFQRVMIDMNNKKYISIVCGTSQSEAKKQLSAAHIHLNMQISSRYLAVLMKRKYRPVHMIHDLAIAQKASNPLLFCVILNEHSCHSEYSLKTKLELCNLFTDDFIKKLDVVTTIRILKSFATIGLNVNCTEEITKTCINLVKRISHCEWMRCDCASILERLVDLQIKWHLLPPTLQDDLMRQILAFAPSFDGVELSLVLTSMRQMDFSFSTHVVPASKASLIWNRVVQITDISPKQLGTVMSSLTAMHFNVKMTDYPSKYHSNRHCFNGLIRCLQSEDSHDEQLSQHLTEIIVGIASIGMKYETLNKSVQVALLSLLEKRVKMFTLTELIQILAAFVSMGIRWSHFTPVGQDVVQQHTLTFVTTQSQTSEEEEEEEHSSDPELQSQLIDVCYSLGLTRTTGDFIIKT